MLLITLEYLIFQANEASPAMRSAGAHANTCDGHFFFHTKVLVLFFPLRIIHLCLRWHWSQSVHHERFQVSFAAGSYE
jgi:hypothetical protein